MATVTPSTSPRIANPPNHSATTPSATQALSQWTPLTARDTLGSSGGIPPFTWSLVSGQLPPGIVLGMPDYPSELNGIPTVAGKYTFTIRVTDSLGNQATQQFRLTTSK
jgi:hypothetical protein